MTAYIISTASFLPNPPIDNDTMESVLGIIQDIPSKTRRIILRNNRIKYRHYAIDPATGAMTHTNTQLTAEAVKLLNPYNGFSVNDIQCLCCGTSTPDQLMPGHSPMVQGELGIPCCDVMSASGICTSGMVAMRYAWLNVLSGQTSNAVATGSELASSFTRSSFCGSSIPKEKLDKLDKKPVLSFEADFLRWMLSDGAGAVYISDKPKQDGLSLKIEWIDLQSFAGEYAPCMYAGANKKEDGTLQGWRDCASINDAMTQGSMLIKQDVKLLNQEIIPAAVDKALVSVGKKYQLKADDIDWFLPHYSSNFFRSPFHDRMEEVGFGIPFDRWFTNLESKGNTGAASIFIIIDELFKSGKLKAGEKILCFIPESGRFSMCYMLLTVC